MKSRLFSITLFIVIFASCQESSKIIVRNNVHNVKLESISWGDVSIYYSLLPGESSGEVTITDKRNKFPKHNQLEFYMVSKGRRVYLKTKEIYQLDADQTLTIEINDETEVINPLLE
jgi:hypothetical protein